MTRPSTDHTRRGLLKGGAAALASSIATAGCLSLPPLGSNQSFGRITPPPADDPTYRRWVPAPSELDGDRTQFEQGVVCSHPVEMSGPAPSLFLFWRGLTKTRLDYFGVGFADYDRCLETPFGVVVHADFDLEAVGETLVESGYEREGSYRGYTTYARSDIPRRAAVRDGTIVWASERVHENPNVEILIDTGAGDRPRYHEVDEDFERITDALGASRTTSVRSDADGGGPTGTADFVGTGFRIDGDTLFQIEKLLFPEGRAPSARELESAFSGRSYFTDEADVFDVTVDGRLGTAEARVPMSRGTRTAETAPPQVTWGVSFDPSSRTFTLRHEAGASIDASRLTYRTIGAESGRAVDRGSPWGGNETVSPGDEATIDLSDDPDVDEISFVFDDADGNRWYLFEHPLDDPQ